MTVLQTFGFSLSQPAGLTAYLGVAALLFMFGFGACISRRNAVGILIGIELMLNAGVINFMAFWRFAAVPHDSSGLVMSVFVILLAACEAAVALAILLNLYFNFGSVDVDYVHEMKR